jgi:hypothetical protein
MVRSRIIKIHRALHETQTKKPDIKIEVPLRIARDRSDVMKSRDFIVHQDDDDLRLMARADSSACALAFVLKGQLQARSELDHFAVLDLHIQLHNFGDTQIAKRASGGPNRILCGILPGLRTCADYFRYSVD